MPVQTFDATNSENPIDSDDVQSQIRSHHDSTSEQLTARHVDVATVAQSSAKLIESAVSHPAARSISITTATRPTLQPIDDAVHLHRGTINNATAFEKRYGELSTKSGEIFIFTFKLNRSLNYHKI